MSIDPVRTVTRISCWSVRQCTQRAAALLQASERIVGELDAMALEIGMVSEAPAGATTRCVEHQAIVTQLDHLHTLVEHCLVNLRNGFAAPPTPEAAAPKPASPPMPLTPTPWPGATAAQAPAAPKPAPKPAVKPAPRTHTQARADVVARVRSQAALDGLLDLPAIAQRTGLSIGTLYGYRTAALLPPPHTRRAGIPLWHEAQLAAFERGRRRADIPTHHSKDHAA